jgi:hypothetical protein
MDVLVSNDTGSPRTAPESPEPEVATYATEATHAKGLMQGRDNTQINIFGLGWSRSMLVGSVIVAIVLVVSAATVVTVSLSTKPTLVAAAVGPAEVFLEQNDQPGQHPFLPTRPPSIRRPPPTMPGPTLPSAAVRGEVRTYAGGEPGIYSATRNVAAGDLDDVAGFYQQHPDQARVFAEAVSRDPSFEWSRGRTITGADVPQYLRELTPVLLRLDTRVTDHGWDNLTATPRPAILQAGTAVLVDTHGVPRLRSLSGSPLTAPEPQSHTPTFVGTAWPGFQPQRVIAVTPSTSVLASITLVDVDTGQPFDRPVGTAGAHDSDDPEWPTTSASVPTTPPTSIRAAPSAPPATSFDPTLVPAVTVSIDGIRVAGTFVMDACTYDRGLTQMSFNDRSNPQYKYVSGSAEVSPDGHVEGVELIVGSWQGDDSVHLLGYSETDGPAQLTRSANVYRIVGKGRFDHMQGTSYVHDGLKPFEVTVFC